MSIGSLLKRLKTKDLSLSTQVEILNSLKRLLKYEQTYYHKRSISIFCVTAFFCSLLNVWFCCCLLLWFWIHFDVFFTFTKPVNNIGFFSKVESIPHKELKQKVFLMLIMSGTKFESMIPRFFMLRNLDLLEPLIKNGYITMDAPVPDEFLRPGFFASKSKKFNDLRLNDGDTYIHFLVATGFFKLLLFLTKQSNFNKRCLNKGNFAKDTPLHYALEFYKKEQSNIRLKIIHALLHHGAEKHIKNNYGVSPLDIALGINEDCARLLKSFGENHLLMGKCENSYLDGYLDELPNSKGIVLILTLPRQRGTLFEQIVGNLMSNEYGDNFESFHQPLLNPYLKMSKKKKGEFMQVYAEVIRGLVKRSTEKPIVIKEVLYYTRNLFFNRKLLESPNVKVILFSRDPKAAILSMYKARPKDKGMLRMCGYEHLVKINMFLNYIKKPFISLDSDGFLEGPLETMDSVSKYLGFCIPIDSSLTTYSCSDSVGMVMLKTGDGSPYYSDVMSSTSLKPPKPNPTLKELDLMGLGELARVELTWWNSLYNKNIRLTIRHIAFEKILSGKKIIEGRLDTPPFKEFLKGMTFCFVCSETKREQCAQIITITKAPTFEALMSCETTVTKLGFTNQSEAIQCYNAIYDMDSIHRLGVLGIEFRIY